MSSQKRLALPMKPVPSRATRSSFLCTGVRAQAEGLRYKALVILFVASHPSGLPNCMDSSAIRHGRAEEYPISIGATGFCLDLTQSRKFRVCT